MQDFPGLGFVYAIGQLMKSLENPGPAISCRSTGLAQPKSRPLITCLRTKNSWICVFLVSDSRRSPSKWHQECPGEIWRHCGDHAKQDKL